MQNIETILTIATTAIGLLITTITFILKFIQSEKAKKASEHISRIGNIILDFIAEAEAFVGATGAEKKCFVLEKARRFAEENNLNYDAEAISKLIEDYVHLSKLVNNKKNKNISE